MRQHKSHIATFLLTLLASGLLLGGCSAPPLPPEVAALEQQRQILRREGAKQYAPSEMVSYEAAVSVSKDILIHENARMIPWFRDYEKVGKTCQDALTRGKSIQDLIAQKKQEETATLEGKLAYHKGRLDTLRSMTTLFNEGRIGRRPLMTARLAVEQAERLHARGETREALKVLDGIPEHTGQAVKRIMPILSRYTDHQQIRRWQGWVDQTIQESRSSGGYAIVVSKLDRKLTLYRGGRPVRSYAAGLGINGSKDKLHSGDRATPEGRYHIAKKISKSRYYKALLINYPNQDDRAQFARAKRKGLIPRGAGIGGLIEIHGGGSVGMTYGCVALENNEMDDLFSTVEAGTPVTIVGTTDDQNILAEAMKSL